MKFFRKEKNQKRKNQFGTNSHSHLRTNVKKDRPKMPKLKVTFDPKFKKYSIIFSVIIFLAVTIFGTIFYSGFFLVRIFDVRVSGTENFEQSLIVDRYKNTNIFTFNLSSVENYIKDNYQNVNNIYVRKILPDKLDIEIEFNQPKRVYVGFEKYSIVGENSEIIETADLEKKLDVDEQDLEIFYGFGDKNAIYVREKIRNSLDEEGRREFNWEDIEDSQKQETLNALRNEVQQKVNEYKSAAYTQIDSEELDYIFFIRVQSNYVEQRGSYFEFTEEVHSKLLEKEIEIKESVWKSLNTLEITSEENKKYLFGYVSRSLEEQFDDFELVFKNKIQGSVFDFTSKNNVYK